VRCVLVGSPGAVAGHEQTAQRGHLPEPTTEYAKQAGRHRERRCPVQDPKRPPLIVSHLVIPAPAS
jgi:hypothetical protein